MMKILLTGKNGQLGFELAGRLRAGFDLVAVDVEELDLTDAAAIEKYVTVVQPDLIINAAAYTAVDQAEQDDAVCHAVNAQAPAVLARMAEQLGIGMIHYSTDYVFDGSRQSPYTESDPVSPLGVYGKTKLEGEQAVLNAEIPCWIFRTSWVYGPRGKNFYLTMRRLLTEREEVRVVRDQVGSPTSALMLADLGARLIVNSGAEINRDIAETRGVYHLSGQGRTSWYEFAVAIRARLQTRGLKVARLVPITTAEYPTPARRPAFSVLDCSRFEKVFGLKIPLWQESLDEVFEAAAAD